MRQWPAAAQERTRSDITGWVREAPRMRLEDVHICISLCDLQVTLITTKLLLKQSDLVSLSLTIALPKALGSDLHVQQLT